VQLDHGGIPEDLSLLTAEGMRLSPVGNLRQRSSRVTSSTAAQYGQFEYDDPQLFASVECQRDFLESIGDASQTIFKDAAEKCPQQ
jgi:hypothetical protein